MCFASGEGRRSESHLSRLPFTDSRKWAQRGVLSRFSTHDFRLRRWSWVAATGNQLDTKILLFSAEPKTACGTWTRSSAAPTCLLPVPGRTRRQVCKAHDAPTAEGQSWPPVNAALCRPGPRPRASGDARRPPGSAHTALVTLGSCVRAQRGTGRAGSRGVSLRRTEGNQREGGRAPGRSRLPV